MDDLLAALKYFPEQPLVFHSVLFFILFAVFYAVYSFTYHRIVFRNILLLVFSLFFYYKISGLYVILLVAVATSDYFLGRGIYFSRKRSVKRLLLSLSLLVNIGILIFFKYLNFLIESWAGWQGVQPSFALNIITPLGISFYIFKSLSYIFDVYRENIEKAEKNYLNYLVYVSFFPNVLSGPIVRAGDLLPQLAQQISIDREKISTGFFLILAGAFKKIFIADVIAANLVNRVFDSFQYFGGFEILMAGYGYTIQLYFDFSGYTDMVIGIALLLGFITTPNFNKPFLAQNVTDFWRRWHITLSTWLRDYLFSPLSVKLRNAGKAGLAFAVLITFIVCGIWHGPNLTYILWGTLHGLAMGWDIMTQKIRKDIRKSAISGFYKVLSIILTFHFLVLTFMVFRSKNLENAWLMIQKMFTGFNLNIAVQWMQVYIYPFLIMILGLILHYTPVSWNNHLQKFFVKIHWSIKALIIAAAIIIIYQAYSMEAQPFIYLEF